MSKEELWEELKEAKYNIYEKITKENPRSVQDVQTKYTKY